MQSIVVFGRYRMIDSGSKAMELLKKLALKYYPRREAGGWENCARRERCLDV